MSYLPIEQYGLIGNMRTAALVGTNGSIDWFCYPSFDAPSVFCALLDETRVATARREKTFPTMDQVKHVIATMPAGSDTELRNRAVIAFILLTGARDSAAASMSLKHVDLAAGCGHQDARDAK